MVVVKKVALKVYRFLTLRGFKNFNKIPDVAKWRAFIESLPYGNSAYQRSLNKYHCRMHYFGFFYKIIINIISTGALIFITIPALVSNKDIEFKEKKDAILVEDLSVPYENIIPKEILARYSSLGIIKNERTAVKISQEARAVFLEVWKKNPLRPHYVYWVFRELAFISQIMEEYLPNAIIVYVNERNVASPIITQYLEKKGIKFVTFMHGDYTLQLIQGYMEFSEFYVWDQHYIDMFVNDLKCPLEQFRLYLPEKLSKKYNTTNETVDITYYLGSESDLTLRNLGLVFRIMKSNGLKCQARRHPRRYNQASIEKNIDKDQIQDPNVVSIDDSIDQSKYIVSLNSTVLIESLYGGKKIIVDDVTDVKKYNSLRERKGIILSKPHILLSEFLDKIINKDGEKIC